MNIEGADFVRTVGGVFHAVLFGFVETIVGTILPDVKKIDYSYCNRVWIRR